jgi:hypothetical protein
MMGWDNVVGTTVRYGLDGPGIEYWWWRDFSPPSRPAPLSTQPPVQRVHSNKPVHFDSRQVPIAGSEEGFELSDKIMFLYNTETKRA